MSTPDPQNEVSKPAAKSKKHRAPPILLGRSGTGSGSLQLSGVKDLEHGHNSEDEKDDLLPHGHANHKLISFDELDPTRSVDLKNKNERVYQRLAHSRSYAKLIQCGLLLGLCAGVLLLHIFNVAVGSYDDYTAHHSRSLPPVSEHSHTHRKYLHPTLKHQAKLERERQIKRETEAAMLAEENSKSRRDSGDKHNFHPVLPVKGGSSHASNDHSNEHHSAFPAPKSSGSSDSSHVDHAQLHGDPENEKRNIEKNLYRLVDSENVAVKLSTRTKIWLRTSSFGKEWLKKHGTGATPPPPELRPKCPRIDDFSPEELATQNAIAKSFQSNAAPWDPKNLHLLVVADASYAHSYRRQIRTLECYSDAWGYTFKLLEPQECSNWATTVRSGAEVLFQRHCIVEKYLASFTGEGSTDIIAAVLDADIISTGIRKPFDYFIRHMLGRDRPIMRNEDAMRGAGIWEDAGEAAAEDGLEPVEYSPGGVDVLLFERCWKLAPILGDPIRGPAEVVAGAYLVRNTLQGRSFLRAFSCFAERSDQILGFHSADNGGLHLVLTEVLGRSGKRLDGLDKRGTSSESDSDEEGGMVLAGFSKNKEKEDHTMGEKCRRQFLALRDMEVNELGIVVDIQQYVHAVECLRRVLGIGGTINFKKDDSDALAFAKSAGALISLDGVNGEQTRFRWLGWGPGGSADGYLAGGDVDESAGGEGEGGLFSSIFGRLGGLGKAFGGDGSGGVGGEVLGRGGGEESWGEAEPAVLGPEDMRTRQILGLRALIMPRSLAFSPDSEKACKGHDQITKELSPLRHGAKDYTKDLFTYYWGAGETCEDAVLHRETHPQ